MSTVKLALAIQMAAKRNMYKQAFSLRAKPKTNIKQMAALSTLLAGGLGLKAHQISSEAAERASDALRTSKAKSEWADIVANQDLNKKVNSVVRDFIDKAQTAGQTSQLVRGFDASQVMQQNAPSFDSIKSLVTGGKGALQNHLFNVLHAKHPRNPLLFLDSAQKSYLDDALRMGAKPEAVALAKKYFNTQAEQYHDGARFLFDKLTN